MSTIDFSRINAAVLPHLGEFLPRLLPGGRIEGGEFVCGDVSGTPGRSLSINIRTGVWRDFAGDDGGSDPVSLVAAIKGMKQGEAARELAREFGLDTAAAPQGARRRIVASYDYHNPDGTILFQVTRWEPKKFTQRRPDGNGGWINSVKDIELVPYRLPEVIKATAIFIAEGEKDADALAAIGLTATCNAMGAGKWRPYYNQYFSGKRVCILPDNDQSGRKHAQDVAQHLHDVAEVVKIVVLPGLPPKGDISDWLSSGGTREALLDLVRAAPAWTPATTDPGIMVIPGQHWRVVDEAEGIFLRENLPLQHRVFQRSTQLVHVAHVGADEAEGGISRQKGSPVILEADRAFLQDVLGRYGVFKKHDRRAKMTLEVDPPKTVAETYQSRVGMWKVPHLRGIMSAPTILPSGKLVAAPGYDPHTGYFFSHDIKADVPERPSFNEACDALALVDGLLAGFAFPEGKDRAVALAQVMTLIVRPGLPAAPLFVTSAHCRGSGKSHLTDTAAAIGTGRKCTVLSAASDPVELEKRLVAAMLAGDQIVSLDNVNGVLRSDLLCQAITAHAVKIRPLGVSQQVDVANSITWVANGNNITIHGDLARRALLCRLDPGLERPEERHFDFDPVSRALERRQEYVNAILTVIRGYFAANCPNMGLTPFGSFEIWSKMVRFPLVWAGCADPCESRAEILEDDPDAAQLRALVAAWWERFGRTPRIVKEVINTAKEDDSLAIALDEVAGDGKGGVNTRRFGWWLRQHAGRIVEGKKLIQYGVTCGTAQWKIVPGGE